MIGVCSSMVREFGGVIDANEVELIELSLADTDFLRDDTLDRALKVKETYDVEFSIHAPYQNSAVERLRIKLSEPRPENLKVMKKVFEACDLIEARRIVVHAGDYFGEKSVTNVIKNLKEICRVGRDYEIALENLYTENGIRRVCETPEELLYVIENVGADNLCANLDFGHANIVARGTTIDHFLEVLDGHVGHMHVHNNFGVRDDHNPPDLGTIDFGRYRLNADYVVLEVKTFLRSPPFPRL